MRTPKLSRLVMLIFMIASNAAFADIIVYDFDNNTLQGWTNVQTSNSGPTSFVTGFAKVDGPTPHGASNVQVVPNIPSFSRRGDGTFAQDDPHTALLLRSPVFRVDGSGDIVMHLAGGSEDNGFPTHESQVLGQTSQNDAGFLGIALRDNNTGAYLRWRSRSIGNNSNLYQQLTIRALDLQSSGFTNRDLTLDLVDSSHGAWGWIALDSVTINGVVAVPEPSALSLALFAAVPAIFRRKRNAAVCPNNRR